MSSQISSLPGEEWKTLPEHSGYQISNLGRVVGPRGLVQPRDGGRGYLRFSVNIDGCKHTYALHQVVCRLFNGSAPLSKPLALHNNHIKTDCRASNLRWGTHRDNMEDRRNASRIAHRLTSEQVLQIRQRYARGASQGQLGREFGVTQQYVGKLVKGTTRKEVPLCCA